MTTPRSLARRIDALEDGRRPEADPLDGVQTAPRAYGVMMRAIAEGHLALARRAFDRYLALRLGGGR